MRLDPPPYRDLVAHPHGGKGAFGEPGMMTAVWQGWMQRLVQMLINVAAKTGAVTLAGQSASLAPTPLAAGAVVSGLHRVNYTLRVTRPASTTSSVTLTVNWIDGGITCSQSGAALTGNTLATQQNGTFVVNLDAGSAVTYATTYVSAGATTMQYAISMVLEQLP